MVLVRRVGQGFYEARIAGGPAGVLTGPRLAPPMQRTVPAGSWPAHHLEEVRPRIAEVVLVFERGRPGLLCVQEFREHDAGRRLVAHLLGRILPVASPPLS